MGKYLDPKPQPGESADEAKYSFCRANGTRVAKSTFDNFVLEDSENQIPVCIIDNGAFSAALICDHQSEINHVRNHPDSRSKLYFLVSKEAIEPYLLE